MDWFSSRSVLQVNNQLKVFSVLWIELCTCCPPWNHRERAELASLSWPLLCEHYGTCSCLVLFFSAEIKDKKTEKDLDRCCLQSAPFQEVKSLLLALVWIISKSFIIYKVVISTFFCTWNFWNIYSHLRKVKQQNGFMCEKMFLNRSDPKLTSVPQLTEVSVESKLLSPLFFICASFTAWAFQCSALIIGIKGHFLFQWEEKMVESVFLKLDANKLCPCVIFKVCGLFLVSSLGNPEQQQPLNLLHTPFIQSYRFKEAKGGQMKSSSPSLCSTSELNTKGTIFCSLGYFSRQPWILLSMLASPHG